ncbi:MAG: hypothetical protein HC896_06055 [Bacteroidales bacterium]|nr:hypothetical protein [Bacteroidales bacterium]
MAGTVDASSGVAMGLEKGGLVVLRGKEAGIYNINDLSVGVGGVSVSAGFEVVKLYTSSATVLKSHFYGPRYEANLSFTVGCVNVGVTAIYARHSQGYTVGYGVTLGVDAIPFNKGFQLNKGASSEYFHQLTPELSNTFNSW